MITKNLNKPTPQQSVTIARLSAGADELFYRRVDGEEQEEENIPSGTIKVVLNNGRGCGCVALVYSDGSHEWLC